MRFPCCKPLLILNILLANVSLHAVIRDLPEIIPQLNLIKCLGKFFLLTYRAGYLIILCWKSFLDRLNMHLGIFCYWAVNVWGLLMAWMSMPESKLTFRNDVHNSAKSYYFIVYYCFKYFTNIWKQTYRSNGRQGFVFIFF